MPHQSGRCAERPSHAAGEQDRCDDNSEHADPHKEDEPVAGFGLDLTPSRQAAHREGGEQSCQAMGDRVGRHHTNRQAPDEASNGKACRHSDRAAQTQNDGRAEREARSRRGTEENALAETQGAAGRHQSDHSQCDHQQRRRPVYSAHRRGHLLPAEYSRLRVCCDPSPAFVKHASRWSPRPELAKAKIVGDTLLSPSSTGFRAMPPFLLALRDTGVRFLVVDLPRRTIRSLASWRWWRSRRVRQSPSGPEKRWR